MRGPRFRHFAFLVVALCAVRASPLFEGAPLGMEPDDLDNRKTSRQEEKRSAYDYLAHSKRSSLNLYAEQEIAATNAKIPAQVKVRTQAQKQRTIKNLRRLERKLKARMNREVRKLRNRTKVVELLKKQVAAQKEKKLGRRGARKLLRLQRRLLIAEAKLVPIQLAIENLRTQIKALSAMNSDEPDDDDDGSDASIPDPQGAPGGAGAVATSPGTTSRPPAPSTTEEASQGIATTTTAAISTNFESTVTTEAQGLVSTTAEQVPETSEIFTTQMSSTGEYSTSKEDHAISSELPTTQAVSQQVETTTESTVVSSETSATESATGTETSVTSTMEDALTDPPTQSEGSKGVYIWKYSGTKDPTATST